MTRDPVPIETLSETSIENTTPETSIETTPPPVSTSMREPSERFINDVALAIRAGASPYVAAEWAGVPRATFKRWMRTHDALRAAVRTATAHLKVKLQTDLAKRSPEKALRRLHVRDEQADQGRSYSSAPRPYSRSGYTVVQRALPHLIARVTDVAIPNADLSPIEMAARQWRDDVITDLGGVAAITTTKMALLNAATGSMIIQSSIDSYLFALAGTEGLASRKHRRLFPVVEQRMRIADSLMRQLQALGLDRAKTNATDLQQYIAEKYGGNADNRGVDDEPQGAPETT